MCISAQNPRPGGARIAMYIGAIDMDEKELKGLEREVEAHMRRIEKIQESLSDSEENLRQVVGAPPELVGEVSRLRVELRGRKAALAVGLSLLNIYQD